MNFEKMGMGVPETPKSEDKENFKSIKVKGSMPTDTFKMIDPAYQSRFHIKQDNEKGIVELEAEMPMYIFKELDPAFQSRFHIEEVEQAE